MNIAKSAVQILSIAFVLGTLSVNAALVVTIAEPKTAASKSVIKLTIQNTFTEQVTSARATLFLVDEKEKVVGQSVNWVIGGSKAKPALKPDGKTTFNFVLTDAKPFTRVKLMFNRVILQNGKLADPMKDVVISFETEDVKK
ncbi:MAG: hypothetical protein SFY81_02850 [Verrucomicrobiota bacterium]|nr:hypothetical protein [Verrucomicrobiota bacterium]